MYFVRTQWPAMNRLVKEAFNVNKALHDDGVYSWTTLFIYNILSTDSKCWTKWEDNSVNKNDYEKTILYFWAYYTV